MLRAFLFLPIVLMLSCGHRQQTGTGNRDAGETGGTETGIASTPGNQFYKRYSGTIGDKPVVVHLSRYGNVMHGAYCFVADGRDIVLQSRADSVSEDGAFLLHEMGSGYSQEGQLLQPTWTLGISGNTAAGTWHSADGTSEYNIELTEEYSAGSTMLDAFNMADSVALKPEDPKSPRATASYAYLLPRDGKGSFLYNALEYQLTPVAAHGEDVESAIRSNMASYFGDYRRTNEHLALKPGDELQAFAFSYTNDQAVYVHYNEDNWLVTELYTSTYTGGAHGNYASSFANIDLAQKHVWKLDEMVTDRSGLRPLLNDAAIAYFGLKPGAGMQQRLLVDEVPPTDNVYVGPKGLSFVYNPYEIASYADGQITLHIPYKKLLPLLSPAFRQRMQLSDQNGVALVRQRSLNSYPYAGRRHT